MNSLPPTTHRSLKSINLFLLAMMSMSSFTILLSGCYRFDNNALEVRTALAKHTSGGGVVYAPLGQQPIAGQHVADLPLGSAGNTANVAPFGSVYNFAVVTTPDTQVFQYAAQLDGGWPTYRVVSNMRMPANWNFEWEHPNYCFDLSNPSYPYLANPYVVNYNFNPIWTSSIDYSSDLLTFYCHINTPANPDFVPSDISQQFALDDNLPSTLNVAAFSPINAASAITNLRVYSASLTNTANSTAISVASNGNSALFPFPMQADGTNLPTGAYIMTITTDPTGANQTTNGMEPFYVAHNDHSFTAAFGVDEAAPMRDVVTIDNPQLPGCNFDKQITNTYTGGPALALVTLPTLGKLAVGTMSNLISVGNTPTVVLAFNDQPLSSSTTGSGCTVQTITQYSGAQSALVVNTGSNSVSVVSIGQEYVPTGTITVGATPVAAVINSNETFAYIANYGSGTISEVNLKTVQVSRTMSVAHHPTAISFDSNGNLWVGSQGFMQLINTLNWAIQSSFPVDGTVTGLTYDASAGQFVGTILRNGSFSNPVTNGTMANAVLFGSSTGVSYSTTGLFFVATGGMNNLPILSDSSVYEQSNIASILAFPGQTAFNPPVYISTNGDIYATANGTTFTIATLNGGKVLLQGNTPHPIRGIKLTKNMLYMTMPESNSLVTLPIQLP